MDISIWLLQMVGAGGAISASSIEAREIVESWHQELRDLTLIMSRQVGVNVSLKLSRAHGSDARARLKDDVDEFAVKKCLSAHIAIPDAAAPVHVSVDLGLRSIGASIWVKAPNDRKSTKARLNWLMRQLQQAATDDLYVRLLWPGKSLATQFSVGDLRKDPTLAEDGKAGMQVASFEVCMVRQIGARLAQPKTFIESLETVVPEFYEQVVQNLKAWQPKAPKVREDRSEVTSVSPKSLAIEVEKEVLDPDP